MNPVKATYTNGQILPCGPVDWPEGSELLVEPVNGEPKIGLDESEWLDTSEARKEWSAWLKTIEPLILTDEERTSLEEYRKASRAFNLEAVRKQMAEMS
jgi:hypothetical protein